MKNPSLQNNILKNLQSNPYITAFIFALMYIAGSNYGPILIGDEVEYVSIAKSIIKGEGIQLFGFPTTIAATWSIIISPFFEDSLNIETSILLARIFSLLLVIISLFQFTFILKKLMIDNLLLSDGKIFIIQLLTFGNLYYWQLAGSLTLEPLSMVVFFSIVMIIAENRYRTADIVWIGLLSAVLVATKYITIIIIPALLIHFYKLYGFSKKFSKTAAVILISPAVLLIPVAVRFLKLEFFTNAGEDFSYMQNYNSASSDSSWYITLVKLASSGFVIFVDKFHEYFTTLPELNAFYISILFLIPAAIFLYKKRRTGFTYSFYGIFTILYLTALIISGYGGNVRYWIIVFPFIIIFLVEFFSNMDFFKKKISININSHRLLNILFVLLVIGFIAAALYLRFTINDLYGFRNKSVMICIAFSFLLTLWIIIAAMENEIWNLLFLMLFIFPFSRALNQFIVGGRPFNPPVVEAYNCQRELCNFLDSKNWDGKLFQNSNAAWTTAYSKQEIKNCRINYGRLNLDKIYLISKEKFNLNSLKISNTNYKILKREIIYSNSLYEVLEMEVDE